VIIATDHASVQINIGHVDANGLFTGSYETVAFSGFVRSQGAADGHLNRIAAEKGLMKNLTKMLGPEKYKKVKQVQEDA